MSQPESKKSSFLTPKKLLLATFAMVSTAVGALFVGVAMTLNPSKEPVAPTNPPKAHTVEILSPVGAPASAVMVAASSIEVTQAPPISTEETVATEAKSPSVATAATAAVAAATVAATVKKNEAREQPLTPRKPTPNTELAQNKTDNKSDKAKDKPKQDKTDVAKNKSDKNTDLAKTKQQDKNKQDSTLANAKNKPQEKTKTASNNTKETPLEPTNRRSNTTTVAAKSSDASRATTKPRPRVAEIPSEPKPVRQASQQKDVMDNLF